MSRSLELERAALSATGWGWRGWIFAGLLSGSLLVGHSHYRLTLVVGDSMRPGLRTGDFLLVDKKAYHRAEPRRGDVVLAPYYDDLIVKRVVGLPQEEVQVIYGQLYLNGTVLAERYPVEPGPLDIGPGRLFRDKYALLGDNRGLAGAVHAVVAKNQLLGKVVGSFRLWPSFKPHPPETPEPVDAAAE